jgi:hypothetical protein
MTIIQGVKKEYEFFIQCLTVNQKMEDLDLETITDALVQEENRRNESLNLQEDKEEQIFYNKEEKLKCYSCNKMGHVAKNCRTNKNRDKKCTKCNKLGHIASDCRSKILKSDDRVNTITEKESSKQIIFHLSEKSNDLKEVWLLDSGTSSHVCCLKEFYKDFEPYNSKIKVGDGREVRVTGKGSVEIKVKTNNQIKNLRLEDVLYVPELKVNLISIGKISKRGYVIIFKENKCLIKINNLVVIQGESFRESENLFEIKINKNDQKAYSMFTSLNDWKLPPNYLFLSNICFL